MACQSVFYKNHKHSNENTYIVDYNEEDRAKERSKENTNVTDEAAERRKTESGGREIWTRQVLTIQVLQSCYLAV